MAKEINFVKLCGSREDFIKMAEKKMGAAAFQSLKEGKSVLTDFALYSVRALESNSNLDLMLASDAKDYGLTNINARKLGSGEYMLVKGIQLLKATGVTASDKNTLKKADFGVIDAQIANGELEIKMGDKLFLSRTSCEMFRSPASRDSLVGYAALDAPKMILPQCEIVPTLYMPVAYANESGDTDAAKATRVAVKIVFHGVKTQGV
ncbi:MAG: hypothetical protein IKR66_06050 [Bacteroidales bacterium]|nr:hypothetical protein [Bacteroidales bacterium]